MVLGGALGPGLGGRDACGAAPLCVAGVALGDIHLRFTWQAWHKLTSTVVLRGRRGTYGTPGRESQCICGTKVKTAWDAAHSGSQTSQCNQV